MNFFTRGFTITLPKPLPAPYATTTATDVNYPGSNVAAMVWHPVLKVPTNGPGGGSFSHTISCGDNDGRTNVYVYNVVSLNLPVAVHPSELNLPTNFVRGVARSADQIYSINTATKGVLGGKAIYCDGSNTWRYVPDPGGTVGLEISVNTKVFKPNDVLIIKSCNGGLNTSWTWTYHPTNFYRLPTRWMGQ